MLLTVESRHRFGKLDEVLVALNDLMLSASRAELASLHNVLAALDDLMHDAINERNEVRTGLEQAVPQ